MNISAVIAIDASDHNTFKKTITSICPHVSEIYIADIGMTDEMISYVKNIPNVTYAKHPKPPYIEVIRQKIIDAAESEWILYLDPDEVYSDALHAHIMQHSDSVDYFTIPRKNIILGHWMQHSRWWPDYQVRVFKKKHVVWSTVIHSQPTLTGKGYQVPDQEELAIEHHNYRTYDDYLQKARRYARAEAEERIKKEESFSLLDGLLRGLSEFISRFFGSDGYKDGVHGFVMAFSQFLYYFQVYVYYWEMRGYKDPKTTHVEKIPTAFFSQALYETLHWTEKKRLNHHLGVVRSKLLKMLTS